MNSYF